VNLYCPTCKEPSHKFNPAIGDVFVCPHCCVILRVTEDCRVQAADATEIDALPPVLFRHTLETCRRALQKLLTRRTPGKLHKPQTTNERKV